MYFYLHTRRDSTETGGFRLYEFDNDLNLISQKDIEEEDIPKLGPSFYISGEPYYKYEDFFADFDSNKSYVNEIIEYDDCVLLVFSHYTFNEYEIINFSSTRSPDFECAESVYTAYSYDGKILWRATVDDTDYEALQKRLDEFKKGNPITLPEGFEDNAFIVPIDPDVPID